ncbi:MAG: alpha/beta hydrolase [Clostridiales bacterium]|nr:alpha/beta hydrolase [Clostridiales bacterium]
MSVSFLGRVFSEIARAAGNVNPTVVEKKKKNLVKDLRSMEPLFRHYIPPRGYSFRKEDVDGVETEFFTRDADPGDKVILVIHGGAYVSRMMFYYRLLNRRYCEASGGGTVVHFEYRCAPEYKYPCALEDTLKVWNRLLEMGFREENIIIIGDSAGGHLSVDLMMKLHDEGRPQPRAAVLMSPWLDMTASGDSYVYNYKVDPVFGIRGQTPSREEVESMLMTSELYGWIGDADRRDPYISPVLADFDDTYPPIFVTVGGYEMLRSESETLVEKFRAAGVDATLYVAEGMFHAFNVYELFPESQRAIKRVCRFISETFFGVA